MPSLNRCVKFGLAICALFTTVADAALGAIGALSTETDGSSEIIFDSFNNREWLRRYFDAARVSGPT